MSFWGAGITCFGGCVLISNIKVVVFSHSFSVLSLFFLIGSVVVYIISFVIVNKMTGISEVHLEFNKSYNKFFWLFKRGFGLGCIRLEGSIWGTCF